MSGKCHKCGLQADGNIGGHVRWCGHVKKKETQITVNCRICNSEFNTTAYRPRAICSEKCKMSREETRKKLSESRKDFLSRNPEKHPWKNREKFISLPCEKFKEALRQRSIHFAEEFSPLPDRHYSCDIAWPDKKIAIEINGNQHYNRDGTLKDYYKERHQAISDAGWKVYEIHYTICYKPELIEKIINSISNNEDLSLIDMSFYLKSNDANEFSKEAIRKQKMDELDSKRLEQLSKIDMTKFGWVTKASLELGVSHTHVRRLVKRLMPEASFYQR